MTDNPLACATHVVADVAASAARFVEWFDYAVAERGTVSTDLAVSWGAPASAGRSYALCRPASGAPVFVRFVEGEPLAGYAPLRTFGWAAIEICVQDVMAVHARLAGSPFEVIGPPNRIAGLPTIHPMQVRGPDGEIVYLTQILTDDPAEGLPIAESAIDKLFILVLACADMPATARWFAETLALDVAPPVAIRYSMLAKAFDLPIEQLHEITTARSGRHIFLEFDAYPAAATARPSHDGALPPGLAICTVRHPDIDRIAGEWLCPPVARSGPLYDGRRVGTLRTPEGALLEVIEG